MKRRSIIKAGAALPILAGWIPASFAQTPRRVPTPAQTEGPFYPSTLPLETDSDLLSVAGRQYRQGEPLLMGGVVEDLEGKPLVGALVEIWQCDHDGHYHHPRDGGLADPDFQGYGQVTTDVPAVISFGP